MIRWIVEGRLGTAPGDALNPFGATVVDVRDLVDKHGNSPDVLRAKINAGVKALRDGQTVVVVCDFGVSRSNAIAAGMLSLWKGMRLDDAIAEIVDRTGEMSIKLEMIGSIRRALDVSTRSPDREGILITGGSGFLGQRLRVALANHFRVTDPSRSELDLLSSTSAIERTCGDSGIGQIIHLAFPRIYTNNTAMGESLTMLRNLIDVSRSGNIRLIIASGAVVFSGYRTALMMAECETPPHPRGVYGETKFLEETLINECIRNGELKASIVRLSPVYGPGGLRPRLISYALNALLAGRPMTTHRYRNGLPRLQLLYLDDAVSGFVKVAMREANSIYHLGGRDFLTPREIINAIAKQVDREPVINEVAIDDDVANVMLNSVSTETLLNWRSLVDLQTGLQLTLSAAPLIKAIDDRTS